MFVCAKMVDVGRFFLHYSDFDLALIGTKILSYEGILILHSLRAALDRWPPIK
jgi:hypothetical protein